MVTLHLQFFSSPEQSFKKFELHPHVAMRGAGITWGQAVRCRFQWWSEVSPGWRWAGPPACCFPAESSLPPQSASWQPATDDEQGSLFFTLNAGRRINTNKKPQRQTSGCFICYNWCWSVKLYIFFFKLHIRRTTHDDWCLWTSEGAGGWSVLLIEWYRYGSSRTSPLMWRYISGPVIQNSSKPDI